MGCVGCMGWGEPETYVGRTAEESGVGVGVGEEVGNEGGEGDRGGGEGEEGEDLDLGWVVGRGG